MNINVDVIKEPVEKYRGEFDLPNTPKKSTNWCSWCCRRKPKHERQVTRVESVSKRIIVQQKEQA